VWNDLEGEIRKEYGWGKSLRWVKECVDARLRSSVSLRTLNQRVHERAGLVPQWREDKLDDVPPVVYVDGLWVTLIFDTQEKKKVSSQNLGENRSSPRPKDVSAPNH
jgi:hypothetical protein